MLNNMNYTNQHERKKEESNALAAKNMGTKNHLKWSILIFLCSYISRDNFICIESDETHNYN